MKIAVIAADGRSGRAFIRAALSEGHTVVAGVHRSNPFGEHRRLRVLKCDATKAEDIEVLVKGADAVVSLIGHIKGSPATVQTDAMKLTIAAMKKFKIKRFVSLTGTGVRFKGDHITIYDFFLNLGVRIIDPQRIKDGIAATDLLKSSQLDWTLLRVLKLQNWKTKGFVLCENGPTRLYVNRDEVADAIVSVLEGKRFIKAAPILSRKR